MLKETLELRNELHDILNHCKNMEPGYTSAVQNALYVRYKGKPYAMHLIEMEDDVVTDRDREHYVHSDDNSIKDWKNLDKLKYLIPKNNF